MSTQLKLAALLLLLAASAAAYQIGCGIWDMTGPSVEINFMGYAMLGQRGQGILQRLRSRAFIIADDDDKDGQRIVFVSVDGGMASDLVKMRVVEALQEKYGDGVYTNDNVAISGTHTHSGPGGFLQYVLYQSTSLGFVQETFDAWVTGIVQSIVMAHNNLQPGDVLYASGKLYDTNINRSPTSYELNPEEEKAQYPDGNTDKDMLLLKFVARDEAKTLLGAVNWFAVHATSMNNTNTLVNGDNKGYAGYLMEKKLNGNDALPGMGPIVTAFASTNLGDVSPNTNGAKCVRGKSAGQPCDGTTSTCNGRCEDCIAFGPGKDGNMHESTEIIGQNQYKFAMSLLDQATTPLSGRVDYRHSFVRFPGLNVTLARGGVATLCSPAMGMSFAAGTTDGPGMFNFAQGTSVPSVNPFWNKVRDFLNEPSEEEMMCQAPKAILINTGLMDIPYAWDPATIPFQLLRVGQLFIVSVPAELTTMSGRRLRKAVREVILEGGLLPKGMEPIVTIAGLANSYSSYVTTKEEYSAQRYEAASTIFGPHTLEGYLQEFSRLAKDLSTGAASTTDPPPQDLSAKQIDGMPGVVFDRVPLNTAFGQVVQGQDAKPSYRLGEVVTVQFHSANPRNNQRAQGSYLTVDLLTSDAESGTFVTKFVDGDWCTSFLWIAGKADKYAFGLSAKSVATVEWTIPSDGSVAVGTYRICHSGDHKELLPPHEIVPFTGCSQPFQVVA